MSDLTRGARAYLIGCYLLGFAALIGMLLAARGLPSVNQWLLAALLAIAAAAAQLMVVSRPGSHYSDHVTPAPVYAALLLLPAPLAGLVICLAFVPEWIRYRRKWFVQTFNIASWLVAGAVSLFVMRRLPDLSPGSGAAMNAAALLAGMVVFVLVQTLMLGVTLKLARGQSLSELGLLAPFKLLSEMALLCIGWFFAFAWQAEPIYAIPAAIPLLVVFEALSLPSLRVEASTDPKTGLANFRHFDEAVNRELERARRNGCPLSLLVCDLDLLRDVNNSFGHQMGDLVLQRCAETIRHGIRGCDLAARFGGDEFVIALSEADAQAAREIAERIRSAFAARRITAGPDDRPVNVTLSIGIASYPEHGDSFETLFREADLALFRAKRDGRDDIAEAGRESRALLGEWMQHRAAESAIDELIPTSGIMTQPRVVGDDPPPASLDIELDLLGDLRRDPSLDMEPAVETSGPRPKPSTQILLFIASVVAMGAMLAIAVDEQHLPQAHSLWIGLALFVGLVVLAHRYAADIDGRGTTSVAVVPMIGAALLFNGLGVVAASAAFAIVAKLKAHSPLHRMLFNFGCMLLATGSSTIVFRALIHEPLRQTPYLRMLFPGILAGLTFYLVNHLFLCLIRSLAERRGFMEIWHQDYRWLWPHYAVAGLLGMTLGVAYEVMGALVTIVMASPVALMHLAITQFIQRTNVYVNELRRLNRQLSDSYESTLQALTRALDTRDAETEEHSQRVKRYTELIGTRLGLREEEIAHLCRGALLHDIGKIGVPDAILLKPSGLSEHEIEAMRKHPAIGYTMIVQIPFLARAAEIVLYHHEAFDGSGYPSGLAGEEIPLGARIFAVVDTLDAMTSDRPYRKALSFEDALTEIERERGRQFDPAIVETLLTIPVAELIRCRDGTWLGVAQDPAPQPAPAFSVAPA